MDINYLLIWMVSISCISQIITGIRSSARRAVGWMIVSGFILAVTAILSYLTPTIAGLVAGGLWAVFVVTPAIAILNFNRLLTQQKFRQARRIATLVRLLHPTDGWREQPEFVKALEMAQEGLIDEATAIFQRYQSSTTAIGRYAAINLYQMNSNWSELQLWIEENIAPKILDEELNIQIIYLRCLGETGDINGLLKACEQFKSSLEKSNLATRNFVRMLVFAFCGEKERVEKLFNDSLATYPETIKKYWLASAEQAVGNQEVARELLANQRNSKDIRIRKAVEWRLSKPCIIASSELTQQSQQFIKRIITEIEQEAKYKLKSQIRGRRANATFLMIGLNLAAFVLEIRFGGSTNIETLYNLGALVPQQVLAGDWWRLLSATFLHFGWMHLTTNMFGLYFFGRLVELILGVKQYLFVYLIASIGSMLAVTWMSVLGYSQTEFAVGASGAVMGLVGVSIAIFLRDWLRDKVSIASQNLRKFLFIILLQTVFDLTTPQISFIGHISGTIIGFLVGMIVKLNWKVRK
ncbi:MAG: rhomboid family intramembrane serine protease [Rivularia sp. (in: Bacteria)]|nr:rhomboid family intramembrane serine protease [Rivularia sp. MS3]